MEVVVTVKVEGVCICCGRCVCEGCCVYEVCCVYGRLCACDGRALKVTSVQGIETLELDVVDVSIQVACIGYDVCDRFIQIVPRFECL
jgi:hypothetical protein